MNRLLQLSLIFSLGFISTSQEIFAQAPSADTSQYPYWIEMMQDPDANFFETQKAFEMYWEGRERDKGDGWKPFKRWEYFMSRRVDEFGNKPKTTQLFRAYQEAYSQRNKSAVTDENHWQEVGPIDLPANGTGQPNGLGRLNGIGFHPTNSNILYVGAPAGGLWKTTDGGQNWECLTDTLPTLGVSSIVVDYSNPNIVYIGTGDRDAGDSYGYGVWKSTDAGETWSPSNTGMGNRTVGKMIMNPEDSMTLLAATSFGIYQTHDAGQSWTRVSSNTSHYKDIVYKPGDTSIVYATEGGDFHRSTDGGSNWSQGATGLPGSNRLVIGVTPANSSYVYVLQTNSRTFKGLYRSTNSGASFTLMSSTPNIMDYSCVGSGSSGQAWYDLDIEVDRLNANVVYTGGVNIFKSTNGGASWSCSAHWVGGSSNCNTPSIHADQHELAISPVNNRLYSCNDGGLYYTSNSGSSWIDISDGLAIAQIYKIGQSAQSRNLVINGYQDNGTAIFDGNWRTEIGGDGMECIVDPADSNYMYGSLYYGDIRRSTNYGIWFSRISNGISDQGEWVTPYLLVEGNSNTMIAGYRQLWRTTNVKAGSVSWTKISTSIGNGTDGIKVLENSIADNDVLYISKENYFFYRSDNINSTTPSYTNITSNLPTGTWPRGIEAHPYDSDSVFIVQSKKVFASGNKGASWTDISGTGLPNVNVNCIVYDTNSAGDLYVGTELGIYFKRAGSTTWYPFNGGMPYAIDVTELEIYYDEERDESRIKAATYGRGLWSSKLYTDPVPDFAANVTQTCIDQTITISDLSTGFYTSQTWNTPGAIVVNTTSEDIKVKYSNPGTYKIELTITNMITSKKETKLSYITIDSLVSVDVTPTSASINRGDTITLTASGVAPDSDYFWDWLPKGNVISSVKGKVVKVYPQETTVFTVELQNTDCNSSDTAKSVITVLETGLEEGEFEGGFISIYPNPVSDILRVQFKDVDLGIKTVVLRDATGKEVFRDQLEITQKQGSFEYNLGSQSNAYYILQVSGEKDVMIFKVLVQH